MTILALDGNSILNRAYYGIRPLTNSKGIFTHAIMGFMNIYLKHAGELNPDGVIAAFDLPAPTFRHKAVSTYKANRKGMPEELAMQMPYIQKILALLGVKVVTREGFEADDILGTVAAQCREAQIFCTILTGDRDSLQLVDECVTVRLLTNHETIAYTPERFREEYGFAPRSLIDLKALMGDSSDNISGVPGVGEKTASKLIAQYHTIETLYDAIDSADLTPSVRKKLTAGRDAAFQSKWLATIVTDVPLDFETPLVRMEPCREEELSALLQELEMKKLMQRLSLTVKDEPAPKPEEKPLDAPMPDKDCPLSGEILDQWANNSDRPVCLYEDGIAYALHPSQPDTVYTTSDEALLRRLFMLRRVTFGAKSQYRFLCDRGEILSADDPSAEDVEILAYLLDAAASSYEIEKLCAAYHVAYPKTSKGKSADLTVLRTLYTVMRTKVEEQGMAKLSQYEYSLTVVLASMEHTGIAVDADGVRAFGERLSGEIEDTEQLIYTEVGHPFNIGSPKQLGDVLFEELDLPHGKKTKTGYSTGADVLEKLADTYPVVSSVLKWRQYTKLKSTYVDGLLKTVAPDGRIHSNFRQTETRTGRISSTEPNLQNIPVRTPLGRNMRRFFIAREGCILLDADYSQIELRLLANLSGDEKMREAFLTGADIHTATAAKVLGLPPEMITPDMRSAAKAINFGILYGMGAYSLSQNIHVSLAQAKKYIESYMAQFPCVGPYMEQIIENAKRSGFVTTYFGRRRSVPELSASNKVVQAAGTRIARNTPIQGTAADIIKLAMIRVYEKLRTDVPDARLILQVHDELIVEVSRAHAPAAAKILGEQMENVMQNTLSDAQMEQFPVPFTAEVSAGISWYDAKE